ncbi:hypothetical protein BKA82DRAFT_4084896 [Pisolithus tinctorius]|nr:hypothetical protein BKA82DRAFT_4084896 [Pisolithus tinctorius]
MLARHHGLYQLNFLSITPVLFVATHFACYDTPDPWTCYMVMHMSYLLQLWGSRTVAACDLYHIPSWSSCYHEFLLARVDIGVIDGEKLMLIIERAPENVAKDTITVVRALYVGDHEYWQRAGQIPVCRGTLQWRDHSPHLLDIVSISGTASAAFKYYNCYVRQCYWYARVILASMAKEGTTSFSKRRFAIFGSHKLSQVQLLVDLHAIYGQVHVLLYLLRALRLSSHLILQAISLTIAGCLETSLAQISGFSPLLASSMAAVIER